MKTAPIVAATLARDAAGVPFSALYGDVYHPHGGPWEQARHVFLAGNGLPARWSGRPRFVVLETGFGLGNNFLATWQAWRDDPARCDRLHVVSIEQHPLTREDLAAVHAGSPLGHLARELVAAWPPLTPDLHRLSFDGGRVVLSLALGDAAAWARELVLQADAFFLDGFAPARNPRMWEPQLLRALGRLAAQGATAATWSSARSVRDGLIAAGFEVERIDGIGGKRDITVARFAPRVAPRRPPGRTQAQAAPGRAVIVGGGLAGAAVAGALSREGWHCEVLDRHARPAQEGSGNLAGLFHGVVHADDGSHARFNRAAALHATPVLREAIEAGVPGSCTGALRLETGLDAHRMRALLGRLGLPAAYVEALDAQAASALAGLPLSTPAWHYPHGGWIAPAALARRWLAAAGAAWRGGGHVARIDRDASGWHAVDAGGRRIASGDVLVLANAAAAQRLRPVPATGLERWRGQVSIASAEAWQRAGGRWPAVPIAGAGYLLPEVDGRALFGATRSLADDTADLRNEDHRANLGQLARLLGRAVALDPAALAGRVGWRCSAPDRLPLVGAMPLEGPPGVRGDQPRFIAREPGLFVVTALGSRGIAWAALCAEVLAGWIAGAPMPVPASLVDAIDPARFAARAARAPGVAPQAAEGS